MIYFVSQLSPNQGYTDEGYLICKEVSVARTGIQFYYPEELGWPPGSEKIPIYRPEEEVFDPLTISSFEGKPVTNDHPTGDTNVDPENIRDFQCGHAQSIRRGTGENADLLLADLVITDPDTIAAVRAGKREISCGYNYDLKNEDGKWIQRKIRGNHIAVVEKGRAGPRVSIKDSEPQKKNERKTVMPQNIRKLLSIALRAKDLAPDDLAVLTETVQELLPAAAPEPVAEEPTPAEPVAVSEAITATPATIETRLDQIIDLLNRLIPTLTDACCKQKDTDNPLDEVLTEDETEEATEEEATPETAEPEATAVPAATTVEAGATESVFITETVDPDPDDEELTETDARTAQDTSYAIRTALSALKPIVAQLPPKQRKSAVDAMQAALRNARMKPATSAADSVSPYAQLRASATKESDPRDLGKQIMSKYNANLKNK